MLAKYGPPADAGENLRRAGDAFARAMELNPDSSIAHHLYTAFEVETLGRASAATVRLVERLRRRAPDPELFAGLVASCRYSGLLEASLAADRQARRLDPRIRTSVMYTHFMLGDGERAMASDVEDVRWVTRYALAVLGREDEAIAGYLADEERPLPVTMRRLMRIVRLAVERRRAEVAAVAAWFREGTFDPEGSYFAARGLTRVGETEAALDMLGGIVERGFYCVPIFIRDPWLDPIRATSRFAAIVAAATARSREAEAAFRRAGGDALLGLGV